MTPPHPPSKTAPYRLTHGAPLSEGEAAHLLTRAARDEALTFAPVRVGPGYQLTYLVTLTPAQLARHTRRVSQCARLLDGLNVPALLTA